MSIRGSPQQPLDEFVGVSHAIVASTIYLHSVLTVSARGIIIISVDEISLRFCNIEAKCILQVN